LEKSLKRQRCRLGYIPGQSCLECRMGHGYRDLVLSATAEDAVDDFGVFPDLILGAREHTDVDAVDRFDTFESRAEGLFHSIIGNSPSGQNLEGEAGLFGLAHHFVHARGIALQVDIVGISSISPLSTFFHSSIVRVRL